MGFDTLPEEMDAYNDCCIHPSELESVISSFTGVAYNIIRCFGGLRSFGESCALEFFTYLSISYAGFDCLKLGGILVLETHFSKCDCDVCRMNSR